VQPGAQPPMISTVLVDGRNQSLSQWFAPCHINFSESPLNQISLLYHFLLCLVVSHIPKIIITTILTVDTHAIIQLGFDVILDYLDS